jgi:prepilin-type N-terminal cleavage/methylation domain-containing protein
MSFPSNRGFTIFEMMISVAIMVIITTVIASNQSSYTSGASLKNVANDLSLSMRQAQVYGISVKEVTPGLEEFTVGYGMAFDLTAAPVGDDKSFIFFADRDVDGKYDDTWDCPLGGTSECLDKTVLTAGNHISDLCIIDALGENCEGITSLDISFARPAIEAKISYNGGSPGVRGARIELSSLDGKTNSVVVYSTGQISVR